MSYTNKSTSIKKNENKQLDFAKAIELYLKCHLIGAQYDTLSENIWKYTGQLSMHSDYGMLAVR